MNLHLNKDMFSEIIQETSAFSRVPEEFIEKDYYVSLLLSKIVDLYPDVVFKGGTFLSKCYGLIDRFSEDIDISVHESIRINDKVRRDLKEKITQSIADLRLNLMNLDDIKTRRNFNQYKVEFQPISTVTGGLKSYLLVETYLFSKSFPHEIMEVSSYIHDFLIENRLKSIVEQFNINPFKMKVQKIDRTFVDKIFAICDYFEQRVFNQNSRHLYDIHKIWTSDRLDKKALSSLVKEVASSRSKYNMNVSAELGYNLNKTLNKIISENVYQDDYNEITTKLLYSSCSYEEVIVSLENIVTNSILPNKIKHLGFS